jgi:hypothetical protein
MGKFGKLAADDKPFRVELIDPVNGQVIKDKDGKAAYIDVRAADGAVGRKYDKEERASELEKARKGLVALDAPADPVERNIAKCAALTAAWHLVDPDTGEKIDVPCTVENAQEFYSLPATNWFVQVWIKATNNANFTGRSAKGSTLTQSGVSAEAAV